MGALACTAKPKTQRRTSSAQHGSWTRRKGRLGSAERPPSSVLQWHGGNRSGSTGRLVVSVVSADLCTAHSSCRPPFLFQYFPRSGASSAASLSPVVWGIHCVAASRPRLRLWHVGCTRVPSCLAGRGGGTRDITFVARASVIGSVMTEALRCNWHVGPRMPRPSARRNQRDRCAARGHLHFGVAPPQRASDGGGQAAQLRQGCLGQGAPSDCTGVVYSRPRRSKGGRAQPPRPGAARLLRTRRMLRLPPNALERSHACSALDLEPAESDDAWAWPRKAAEGASAR